MILTLVCLLMAQDSASAKSVEELLRDLRSGQLEVRERASVALKKKDEKALPSLRAAANDADKEVAARIREVLDVVSAEVGKNTFECIERSIENANTLKVAFKSKSVPQTKREPQEAQGTLAKNENKARITFVVQGGQKTQYEAVSDGQHWVWPFYGPVAEDTPPDHCRAEVSGILARIGIVPAMWLREGHTAADKATLRDLKKAFEVFDCKLVQDENNTDVLRYKVRVNAVEPAIVGDVTLWYEPVTLKLRRRNIEVHSGWHKGSLVESYDDFLLDSEMSDESFKLPASIKK